jgi:hypothetical protein
MQIRGRFKISIATREILAKNKIFRRKKCFEKAYAVPTFRN